MIDNHDFSPALIELERDVLLQKLWAADELLKEYPNETATEIWIMWIEKCRAIDAELGFTPEQNEELRMHMRELE